MKTKTALGKLGLGGMATLLVGLAALPRARADETREPPRPPREALEACQDKEAGASCSFTIDGESLDGTCFAPSGKPLACRPDGPPPR